MSCTAGGAKNMTSSAHPVPGLSDLIAAELRALRRGRGVHHPDLNARLGPYLRELSSGPREDDVATRRQVLIAELNACAGQLPDDLRAAITASLALSDDASRMRNFGERVQSLAGQLDFDARTGLRRIDMAEVLTAERIAHELRRRRGSTVSTPTGWYLDEFRTVLRLDTPVPESHENRRIVSTRAGLEEVVAWFDAPAIPGSAGPEVEGEVTYGGRLIRRDHGPGDKFQFVVRLPKPLQPGDKHEYGLLLRFSGHKQLTPHCIFTPECRCDRYDLRVRFHPERLPGWIRPVSAETVRMFQAGQPGEDLLAPDAAGEVHVEFRHPAMYLGYGLQWQP
jgi:hypothetical protein